MFMNVSEYMWATTTWNVQLNHSLLFAVPDRNCVVLFDFQIKSFSVHMCH